MRRESMEGILSILKMTFERNVNVTVGMDEAGVKENYSDAIVGEEKNSKANSYIMVQLIVLAMEMSNVGSIVVALILCCLTLITAIGNVLVCLSVMLVRKLRKPQNYLLVSLAVSDLFVAIIVMPFAIVQEINGKWPLGPSLCDLWVSADVLSCTASILNLCAISVDRYKAITKPLKYASASSSRRMLAVIFAVWLSSACVSLPPVLLLGNEHQDQSCTVSQNFWYQMYATMASFYLPLSVMLVVYGKILYVVADKKKQMSWTRSNSTCMSVDRNSVQMEGLHHPIHHHLQSGSKRTTTGIGCPKTTFASIFSKEKFRGVMNLKDHKASMTLGIIMSAFIVCWLPFFVHALLRPFLNLDEKIPMWMVSLFLWLGYANSALNPLIYATLNRDFRRPFQEILCLRCSKLDELMRREFYEYAYGTDEQLGPPPPPALQTIPPPQSISPPPPSQAPITIRPTANGDQDGPEDQTAMTNTDGITQNDHHHYAFSILNSNNHNRYSDHIENDSLPQSEDSLAFSPV